MKTNEIRLVNLAELKIDDSYQRGLKKHHRKIAANLDTNAVGVIVVNERPDGTLWTIDGQQRTHALLKSGITEWTATVLHLPTVEEEAILFGRLNGTEGTAVKVTQREKFKSLVTAKDPMTMECIEMFKKHGLELRGNAKCIWPTVSNTGFVLGFTQVHGTAILDKAISILTQSWPMSDEAMSNQVVGAVCRLVGNYPDLNEAHAVKRFKAVPALKVQQQAKKIGHGLIGGAVEFLKELYNKKMIKNKLA